MAILFINVLFLNVHFICVLFINVLFNNVLFIGIIISRKIDPTFNYSHSTLEVQRPG